MYLKNNKTMNGINTVFFKFLVLIRNVLFLLLLFQSWNEVYTFCSFALQVIGVDKKWNKDCASSDSQR